MASKKNTTKRNEGLYLEDQLHNLIYSDKVFSMIARVIEDKFEEQLEEKVKTYCQKFINKEIDKE